MRFCQIHLILFGLLIFSASESKAITVIGHLTHERTTSPGGHYAGRIILENNSDRAEEVVVYQTDYSFQANGLTEYAKPGTLGRSNATWITLRPSRILVEAHSHATINYEIQVPEHGTSDQSNEVRGPLRGTFWSMIMIESVPPGRIADQKENRIAIRSVIRYGVQVVTHVGEGGTKQINFDKTRLYKENDHQVFQIDLSNSGETWLKPQVSMELFDLEGHRVGRYESRRTRTFPGTSVRHTLQLNVPKGSYKALIVADCGGEDLFGNQLTLNIE